MSCTTTKRKEKRMQVDDKKLKEMEEKLAKYEKMKATSKKAYERRNARITLMLDKAKKANIKVSDGEVDAYLKLK